MLYDVFYPGERCFDKGVGRGYLQLLADRGQKLARAVNTNWDGHVLFLWQGEWVRDLPPVGKKVYGEQ